MSIIRGRRTDFRILASDPVNDLSEVLHLSYLWGGSAIYPAGASLGPRVLEDFELVWIVAGRVTYTRDGQELEAPPGTVLLTRPGFRETWHWDPDRPSRHAFLHLAATELPSDWSEPGTWPVSRAMLPGDPVRPLFRRALDEWCDGSRRRERPPRRVSRLVEALIDSYLARPIPAAGGEATPPAVRRALAWIGRVLEDDPARSISLPELAAAVAVTPKHLCRLFAASLGRSPMATVRSVRLERAMLLLARTDLTIQEIALSSGFISPYHFSRAFRAAYGLPPSRIRHGLRTGAPPPPSRGTPTA